MDDFFRHFKLRPIFRLSSSSTSHLLEHGEERRLEKTLLESVSSACVTWGVQVSTRDWQQAEEVMRGYILNYRLKKREPLIVLGSNQGGVNFCVRSTPLREGRM